MFYLFTTEEIRNAPEAVQNWVYDQTKTLLSGSDVTQKSQPVPVVADEPGPSKAEVLEAAAELIKAGKQPELKRVLEKLGINRVSECPDEKLAELLMEMSFITG